MVAYSTMPWKLQLLLGAQEGRRHLPGIALPAAFEGGWPAPAPPLLPLVTQPHAFRLT